MALKNTNTTSDYLEWDTMLSLVRRLYRDGNYRMSLLIGCGSFFGLRISDLRELTWSDLLDEDTITLNEIKTGKARTVKINSRFHEHIQDCYDSLGITDKSQKVFISRKGCVYSTQQINRLFKQMKSRYGLRVAHFSTHSLRKTFGRRVVEQAGVQSEMALIKLSEIFNHSSPMVTRRYLGIRQQELYEVYDKLDF
jgi:integrase